MFGPQIWIRWMVCSGGLPEIGSMDDLSWMSFSNTVILVYVQFLQHFPWKTWKFSAYYLKFFQVTTTINSSRTTVKLAQMGEIKAWEQCIIKEQQYRSRNLGWKHWEGGGILGGASFSFQFRKKCNSFLYFTH